MTIAQQLNAEVQDILDDLRPDRYAPGDMTWAGPAFAYARRRLAELARSSGRR
jgi:hypothetical protein